MNLKLPQVVLIQLYYLDETGASTTISNVSTSQRSITFDNKAGNPRVLQVISASNVSSFPLLNVTANIYINGTLVKTGKDKVNGSTGSLLKYSNSSYKQVNRSGDLCSI